MNKALIFNQLRGRGMCKNLLSVRYIQKFLTVVSLILWASIPVSTVFISEAHAGTVPSHLAKMAGSLYKATAGDLRQPGKDARHTEARKQALEILNKTGMKNWASGSVSIDKGLEKGGARTATIETGEGEVVELKWSPDTESFSIIIKTNSDSDDSLPDIVTLKGKVKTTVKKGEDGSGDDLILEVEPGGKPVHVFLPEEDLEEFRANILGEWEDEEGNVYTFSAAGKTSGDVKVVKSPREFDRKIADLVREVERLASNKLYIWENQETKEITRQEKFRKLKEPWEYLGEKIDSDSAVEITGLKKRIADLHKAKEDNKPPLIESDDPSCYERIAASPEGQPLKFKYTKFDGSYTYQYDQATFNGMIICARRTLRDVEDLSENPMWVRQELVAKWNPPEWVELELQFDSDTDDFTMEGRLWRLHVTYSPDIGKVYSIQTPYARSLALKRPDQGISIKIGELDISYDGWWMANNLYLENELRLAKEDIKRENDAYNERQNKSRDDLKKVISLKDEAKALAEEIADHDEQLKIAVNNLKTAKYSVLEERIDKQIRSINNKFALKEDLENPLRKKDLDYINADLAAREKTLRQLEQKLTAERSRLNIDRIIEERLKKIELLQDRHFDKKIELNRAERDLDRGASMSAYHLDMMFKAEEEYSKANKAYKHFLGSGEPLVTKIENDYYLAQLWIPEEEIKKLNEKISNLRKRLQTISQRRSEYRDELIRMGDVVTGMEIRVVWAIWKSNLLQAGVEFADFAREMYEAGKGGPQALLAGAVKKALELSVFGAPSYYDGKFELSGYLPSSHTEGEEKVVKRLYKTAMGTPFKATIKQMVVDHQSEIFHKMLDRLSGSTWVNELIAENPNIPSEQLENKIMEILHEQEEKLVKASEKFQDSIGEKWKLTLGADLAKSFAKGMLKDFAKEALKNEVADFFEGQAMREYALAQYELQGNAILLLRSSNHYWMLKDVYDLEVAVRNKIIETYDPLNHMAIKKRETAEFPNGSEPYYIAITDNKNDSFIKSKRQMEVTLGGVKAIRDKNGSLEFTIPADDIKNIKDRKKGATLKIKVLK